MEPGPDHTNGDPDHRGELSVGEALQERSTRIASSSCCRSGAAIGPFDRTGIGRKGSPVRAREAPARIPAMAGRQPEAPNGRT